MAYERPTFHMRPRRIGAYTVVILEGRLDKEMFNYGLNDNVPFIDEFSDSLEALKTSERFPIALDVRGCEFVDSSASLLFVAAKNIANNKQCYLPVICNGSQRRYIENRTKPIIGDSLKIYPKWRFIFSQ